MSAANYLGFKGKIVSAKINYIVPHVWYGEFSELLTTTDYMLPSTEVLTEQAMSLCLLMHPIVVIHYKKAKDRYQCIGGLRSLLLAKASLPLDTMLSVTFVERPPIEEIILAVNADVLLSPLLMSIRNPATIGTIYKQMCKEEIDALLTKGNKTSLAKQMGYQRNTVFPPKKNLPKIIR